MKKGTTVENGYDAEGRWHLKIKTKQVRRVKNDD